MICFPTILRMTRKQKKMNQVNDSMIVHIQIG